MISKRFFDARLFIEEDSTLKVLISRTSIYGEANGNHSKVVQTLKAFSTLTALRECRLCIIVTECNRRRIRHGKIIKTISMPKN